MNGRPTTDMIPRILRRPLLWAALCSVILHLPVLVLWSYQQTKIVTQLQPEPLQILLSAVAQSGNGSQSPVLTDNTAEAQQGSDSVEDSYPVEGSDPVEENEPVAVAQAAPFSAVPSVTPSVTPSPVPSPALNPSPTPSVNRSSPPPRTQQVVPPAPATLSPAPDTEIPAIVSAPGAVEELAVAQSTVAEFSTSFTPPVPRTPSPGRRSMSELDVSGVEEAIQTLLQQINNEETLADLLSGSSHGSYRLTPETYGLPGSDVMTIVAKQVNDLGALQQVDVTLTRRINGEAYQMRARLQERALSHYAKFINRWDDNVMLSNDRIDGRFHANSEVNFETAKDARPEFNGEVTIALRQPLSVRLRQSGMFAQGIRTGTGRISLPALTLPAHWLATGARVLRFETDTRLDFQGEAGVIWTDLNNNSSGQIPVPDEGLIIEGAERTRFELSGTVVGNVLVYSPRQLLITNDLVYANTSAVSGDTLSLISEGSIEIAPASVTGAGDLEIHGALYARQRFSVRRFRERHQGTLYVYGALVAGSVSATEPRFHTHIEYDSRFEHSRPPAFPSTGLFDLMAWEQHWTKASDSAALFADAADNAQTLAP